METKQVLAVEEGKGSTINSFTTVNEDRGISTNNSSSVLKKEIASHALYGLLLESHLNCLKLCLGNTDTDDQTGDDISVLDNSSLLDLTLNKPDQSELDLFMEAYCVNLDKLLNAMEEPQRESMAFIRFMHSQLKDLVENVSSSPS